MLSPTLFLVLSRTILLAVLLLGLSFLARGQKPGRSSGNSSETFRTARHVPFMARASVSR
jgi:hypothetical protein